MWRRMLDGRGSTCGLEGIVTREAPSPSTLRKETKVHSLDSRCCTMAKNGISETNYHDN